MQRIYFDNAATTSLDPEVLQAMMPYLTEKFGNPSSVYSYGRETKMAIEAARKSLAKILNCAPGEIFFTSGGTESTNTAIQAAIQDLHCEHIITSSIEHHATLHTAESCAKKGIPVSYVKLLENGHIDLEDLEHLLATHPKSLVSLMHANNEIGNLLKVKKVGELCEKYGAIFHCDMVQTIGHYPIDFEKLKVHFASAAAHKFHGPKGVGLLYIHHSITIQPILQGGSQERNMRAGTENLYGIVGLGKALELAAQQYETDMETIGALKLYMLQRLENEFEGIVVHGDARGHCLYTVLNVGFPLTDKSEMLLFNLDIAGICVSGGSACSSGVSSVSHVIHALQGNQAATIVPIRFSFCRKNTKEEVDQVIEKIKGML